MTEELVQWTIMDAWEEPMPGCLVLDGWELKKQLDKGGFGRVFLAEKSVFGIRDQAAIKIIRIPKDTGELDAMRSEGLSEDEVQAELRRSVENAVREIRAMVGLRSCPAAVSCEGFDVVQYEADGTWSILIRMELLKPLTQWARETEVTPENVSLMGVTLCMLLAECEKRNILHRDIKPANVFVDEMGNFRLGDFGLARAVTDVNSVHSKAVGTEAFMAPEVAVSGVYDFRADIYSLGLVMYWLLNHQQLPFYASGLSRMEAVAKRLAGDPLPLLAGTDPALDEAIRKACDPKPENRWKSAAEFAAALRDARNKAGQVRVEKPAPVEPQPAPAPVPKPPQPAAETVPAPAASPKPRMSEEKKAAVNELVWTAEQVMVQKFNTLRQAVEAHNKQNAAPVRNTPVKPDSRQEGAATHLCRFEDAMIKTFLGTNEEKFTVPTIGDKGQQVYAIGPEAFIKRQKLKEVIIPEGITSIMSKAFFFCSELRLVTLPDSLVHAEKNAFDFCSGNLKARCHSGTYAEEYCKKVMIPIQYI